jgi:hypothetical protein
MMRGLTLGPGFDTRISVGALLEILLVISNIATAIVIFPIDVGGHLARRPRWERSRRGRAQRRPEGSVSLGCGSGVGAAASE